MATACFALFAPCLPLRTWSISSFTNSPAAVLGLLPCRRSRFARAAVRFSGMGFPSVELSQLVFRLVQHSAPSPGKLRAGAVDVEAEHRHRRAERRALAGAAALGRALEGRGDRARAAAGEHAGREA